jgi:hypothetical protein
MKLLTYLNYGLGSVDEAERVYALLSEEGQIFMPMAELRLGFRRR